MKYECIIFDWDGTLVDSLGHIVGTMRAAALEIGVGHRTDTEIKDIIGLELVEAIATLYPELAETQVWEMRERYARIYVESEQNPARFFADIPELLSDLREASRMLGVATGKSRRGLDRGLESLSAHSFFHATRCADETRGKPEPDMLLELLEELRVPAARAVMVGDSHFDLEMAKRAGVASIGVGWGAKALESFSQYTDATCVDNVSALRKALGF